jgi:hypothetical protein
MGRDFSFGFLRAVLMLGDDRLDPKQSDDGPWAGSGLNGLQSRLVEPPWRHDHSLNRTDAIERDELQGTPHAIAHQERTDDHGAGDCHPKGYGEQETVEVGEGSKN